MDECNHELVKTVEVEVGYGYDLPTDNFELYKCKFKCGAGLFIVKPLEIKVGYLKETNGK